MTKSVKAPRPVKAPSFLDALLPIVALILLVGASVALFGLEAVNGPLQVAIILSTMLTAIIILKNGHSWEAISESGQWVTLLRFEWEWGGLSRICSINWVVTSPRLSGMGLPSSRKSIRSRSAS
jgi:hypothetical protein